MDESITREGAMSVLFELNLECCTHACRRHRVDSERTKVQRARRGRCCTYRITSSSTSLRLLSTASFRTPDNLEMRWTPGIPSLPPLFQASSTATSGSTYPGFHARQWRRRCRHAQVSLLLPSVVSPSPSPSPLTWQAARRRSTTAQFKPP